MIRVDGREADQLREVRIHPGFMENAEGSALIEIGKTRVICTATVENRVPRHLEGSGKGWLTAEYSMLPRSSAQRIQRERNGVKGRSHEMQRLIGRSLRTIFDLDKFGARTILVDCDVLQADGGTRTASVTGAYVAVALALERLKSERKVSTELLKDSVSAVSVGVVEGEPVLDLCYLEDAQAEVDMNVVLTGQGEFVEIQGTAETRPFDAQRLEAMLALARIGANRLRELQLEAIGRPG
jgi:ribonuclease PH